MSPELHVQSSLLFCVCHLWPGWLGSRVVIVLDSGTEGRVHIAVATLLGNSLRQTAHNHCASVHPAAKIGSSPLDGCGG